MLLQQLVTLVKLQNHRSS